MCIRDRACAVITSDGKKDRKNFSIENELVGAPLQHIHSFPTDSSPILFNHKRKSETLDSAIMLPEVVINDNKHIIPDSLWGKYWHSPSSIPSDSMVSSHSLDDLDVNINDNSHFQRRDSGSTMINTELKDLILREVFAPICPKKNRKSIVNSSTNANTTRKSSTSQLKSRSSSQDYRCDSNPSLRAIATPTSPLLKKTLQESISNAIDSSNSVMDLKQFHKKEIARENYINEIPTHSKKKVRNDYDDLSPNTSPRMTQQEFPQDIPENGVFEMEQDSSSSTPQQHTPDSNEVTNYNPDDENAQEEPVSYTHLDVYKRQGYNLKGTPPCLCQMSSPHLTLNLNI